ncbi:PREDICTED: transcription factor IIIA-like [Tarenaya hassleriana]|uniref:transcription factor IIIA-like n=1 Tax=Tarenaya hassleriana TaxID=28532 RepID=UPI00053C6688|nr:PREDICTED: transcription factor IIIA-like [Tarenaya hassleriana]XP_010546691.1 PREDICTED: transcription factor IIIA-like [Tarenaya hassleriana]XP_010546692.1 PREDICTED: transcription factor IIIA-like [Tarenaya hassleriana]
MEENPGYRGEHQGDMAGEGLGDVETPMVKDIRRYICQYCGISRSKKHLITSHILSHHQMEMDAEEEDDEAGEAEEEFSDRNTCQECGASFKKPAHLKQHTQSHSLERSFRCTVDDCTASYKRKDHLNRHLLTHKGKLFKCPMDNCNREFSVQGNMKRHLKEFHDNGDSGNDGDHSTACANGQKRHVCDESGCGKVFMYPSKLQKHQDSHAKLESVEAFCAEPDCMKYFTNEECLKAHIRSCHQYINCEICGSRQLKRNMKRHLRTHEEESSSREIQCDFDGCSMTFSNASNLRKHMKAVHENVRPFVCGFPGCSMRFAYKHVRNNHENSGFHTYTRGDFVESDEQFLSRPRGGVKRKQVTAEMLTRNLS